MGGFGDQWQVLNATGYIRPELDHAWQIGPDLDQPRTLVGAASIGNTIYICGGFDINGSPLASCQKLVVDISGNNQRISRLARWQPVSSMPVARGAFSLLAYDGQLYAVGGPAVKQIDLYDPETNAWSTIYKYDVPLPLTFMGAAVIDIPDKTCLVC